MNMLFRSHLLASSMLLFALILPEILHSQSTGVLSFTITSTTILYSLPDKLPKEGLVTWYRFNGNAIDESGNNRDGESHNVVFMHDRFGNENSSIYFDSVDNYVNFGTDPVFGVTNTGSLTISYWVYLTSDNGVPIYKYHHLNSGNSNFYVHNYTNGINVSGNGTNMLTYRGVLEKNRWYNVTVTFDNSDVQIFKDGKLVQTGRVNLNSSIPNSPFQLNRSLGIEEYFRGMGKIDDLGIWNRVLTEEEILTLFELENQKPVTNFSLSLILSDANSNSKALRIGTKSDATLGYDADYDLLAPPAPPAGAFDARITSNGEDFYTNFYPANEQRLEWLITVKPSTNGLPLTIQWDPQALMDSIEGETCVPKNACFGELMLTDAINGSFVNVDMAKASSLTITESFITQLKIVKTTVDFSATIRVADTAGNSMDLGIGTTAGAKAGFDLNLDLYAPPSPPTGAFDARIRTTTDDFLKNILPTTVSTSEWVIVFAPATGSGPVTLFWDPLEFPQEGQMLLTDVINQQLVRVNMRNQSSYTVTMDGLTQLKVVHQLTSSYERQYTAGWNLVGLPLEIQHDAYQDLFSGSLSNTLFSFGSGYQSQTRLQSGKGYWLRFSNASSVTFDGTSIGNKNLTLSAGWNQSI